VGEWDWTERIKKLEVPVLAIHGVRDPSCPLEGARVWISLLRNARLLVVPNAGHMPFVEDPDLFYSAIDTFLRGEWPDRAEVVGVPVPVR
ncbi:MAG: alpha/beta hydrolase, partial [Candidatus Aminicenantaceae bacterium]